MGRKRVLFGTNFPQLAWKACVESVQRDLVDGKGQGQGQGQGQLRQKVVEDFMGGNAKRVFKLEDPESASLPRASL